MTMPYSEITKHFTEEDWRLIKLGSARLKVKVQIARAIGEELLLKNDELSDLLCEASMDFSDKELVQAIEEQVAAVAGTPHDFTPEQRRRIEELTDEVRGWIALAELSKADSAIVEDALR